ncbi:hypothetical protein PHLCEN_2v13221 [Hermanssonia centrifuga]|uniref:Phosphogluconate dehydrogenase NAD-binding putative C-terminal domain-containing protein n=1 Tax=Hermanssonia centrifuga TaxID=98765 RepID=A0A2R6NEU2_9APHY|nr:hypothetical protein PHLCEN_2v13221 [Hermanssonia centrifuga]
MQDTSLGDIASRANWVLSILPPSEAYAFAQRFRDAHSKEVGTRRLAFADCNAVNPETAKLIASVFVDTPIKFIDAGIIGGPPQGQYDPVFYASADVGDEDVLDEFAGLQVHGLKVKLLKGEGASVGDASALKMSYAGITKGIIGICTTMILCTSTTFSCCVNTYLIWEYARILAAHAASPATSQALLHELASSQPVILQRIAASTNGMLPKAYRWVGEMEEISAFVEGGLNPSTTKPTDTSRALKGTEDGPELIHMGLAKLYDRIALAVEDDKDGKEAEDVKVLQGFVEEAKKVISSK